MPSTAPKVKRLYIIPSICTSFSSILKCYLTSSCSCSISSSLPSASSFCRVLSFRAAIRVPVSGRLQADKRRSMGASTSTSRQETASSSDSSRAGDGKAVAVVASSAASGTGSNSNQAQSKRAPLPHKFHEIVAQAATGGTAAAAAELEDQVYSTGVYLAGKTKKYWVHEKTRCNCFMLFARALSITWSDDPRYWVWHLVKETNDSEVEAASLQNVCWLEVHGKLDLSHLTPGVTYDVVFQVMLTEPAYGWSVPVNLRLRFPDGTVQERKEKLQEKPTKQWLELKAGEVKAPAAQPGQPGGHGGGELEVSLFEYDGGLWKKGLLIKGVKIVPKE